MSLRHILLGMLHKPASGYDLKHTFEQQLKHYWSADLAQIYPTLNRMQRDGLLSSHQEPSTQGPPRRIYQRTAGGDEAIKHWLESGPEVTTDRLSWLAQVGFLHHLEFEKQRLFFNSLRDEFIRHRQELEMIEEHWINEDPNCPDRLTDEDFFAHCTLRLGLDKYRTIIKWCDECLKRLDGMPKSSL